MNVSSAARRTRAKSPKADLYLDKYRPMKESEANDLAKYERLERKFRALKAEFNNYRRSHRLHAPYGQHLPRSNTHQRRSAKRLTDDERRAVFHCYEMCEQDSMHRIVSTAAAVQRTAHYLGMSPKTVLSVLLEGINTRDKV